MSIPDEPVESEHTAAVAAEHELMVELLAALLVASSNGSRPRNRIAAIRMARGSASPLLAALEDVRAALAPAVPRTELLAVFVESITRRRAPAVEASAVNDSAHASLETLIGESAALLDRLADEREMDADEARGIDPDEERKARSDAARLRRLCTYHEVIFVGRDVAGPVSHPQHA